MEQFYSGMMILNQNKEEEHFALEIGLPTIGEEIVFYAAVPRAKSSLLEKQISALFANVRIEEKRRLQYFQARRGECRLGGEAENLSRFAVKDL